MVNLERCNESYDNLDDPSAIIFVLYDRLFVPNKKESFKSLQKFQI